MRRSGPRAALILGLTLSTLGPFALLAVTSLGAAWHYPALLPGRWSADSWGGAIRARGRLAEAARTSLLLGCATGVIAAAGALPVGRGLARLRDWRRHTGAALAFLPVAAPPVALATGLQFCFLLLGLGGSLAGVLLAHAIPALGYASLYFLGVFAAFDDRIEDEARTLGASRRQTFMRITLPLLRLPLTDAFVLGFLVSWAQVPLTLIIGGGAVRTLPVEVLGYVQAGQDRYAATGTLLLIAPAVATLAVVRWAARRTEVVAV